MRERSSALREPLDYAEAFIPLARHKALCKRHDDYARLCIRHAISPSGSEADNTVRPWVRNWISSVRTAVSDMNHIPVVTARTWHCFRESSADAEDSCRAAILTMVITAWGGCHNKNITFVKLTDECTELGLLRVRMNTAAVRMVCRRNPW